MQVITGDTIRMDTVLRACLFPGFSATYANAAAALSFSKVTFKDLDEFNKHLDDKGTSIKSKLESLLNKIAGGRLQVTPSVASLEANIAALLAAQKDMMNKIERLTAQEAELNEELDKAILRSMRAEKKLDRLKSAQVQKMEQQATASATTNAGKDKVENGADAGKSSGEYEALAAKFEETRALAEKEREQRDAALAQAKVLQEELTALKIKLSSLGDDDYVRSDVFKQFKSQNEDLIRRINHLEATNRLLREEADKLQAERTAYRTQLNREMQAVTADLEDQIQQRDQDLTRIRSARDELLSDVSQRKAQLEQERTSLEHMKELVQAKEDRIAALELERQRLDSQGEQTAPEGRADIDQLSREQLYEKYVKLERDYESIMKEMPFIEQAYRKMAALSQKKVMDFGALEERVSILIAEKAKADQKYFAVRKDTDTRNAEIRALRIQNGKSSEIISQLKDVEAQNRTLLSNLEKQLTDMKQATSTTMAENKRLEATATDAVRRSEALKQQLNELTALLKEKDAQNMSTVERKMALEAEVEQARIRLDHAQKERDMWKQRCHSTEDKDLSYIKVSGAPGEGHDYLQPRVRHTNHGAPEGFCPVFNLPTPVEKLVPSDLWTPVLQGVSRRQNQQQVKKVSQLWEGIRQVGYLGSPHVGRTRRLPLFRAPARHEHGTWSRAKGCANVGRVSYWIAASGCVAPCWVRVRRFVLLRTLEPCTTIGPRARGLKDKGKSRTFHLVLNVRNHFIFKDGD